jgi:SNF2 family DNA or RNA helicase
MEHEWVTVTSSEQELQLEHIIKFHAERVKLQLVTQQNAGNALFMHLWTQLQKLEFLSAHWWLLLYSIHSSFSNAPYCYSGFSHCQGVYPSKILYIAEATRVIEKLCATPTGTNWRSTAVCDLCHKNGATIAQVCDHRYCDSCTRSMVQESRDSGGLTCAKCAEESSSIWKSLDVTQLELSSKFEVFQDILADNDDISMVVFAKYVATLQLLEAYLHSWAWKAAKADRDVFLVTGTTSQKKRKTIFAKIAKPKRKFLLLITIKIGGTGLNFTTAQAALFMDFQWNPAVERQAEDRIHRIGQTEETTVYRVVSSNMYIDSKIQKIQQDKTNKAEQTLSGIRKKSDLSVDQLYSFFSS